MNLILFGPPGVGKGTQASRLSQKYNLHHISTGDLLRAAIVDGTPLGKIAKGYVESGGLVPDDVIIGLVREILVENKAINRGFLLDGFPRTLEQAKALENLFHGLGVDEVRIIMITAPEEELVQRMIKRGLETGRTDDTEDTIRKRLQVYHGQTEPVKSFYEASRTVDMVDGLGQIEEVTKRITRCFEPVSGLRSPAGE
jgi:adenylate kinase